jgi:hypothetical protein
VDDFMTGGETQLTPDAMDDSLFMGFLNRRAA